MGISAILGGFVGFMLYVIAGNLEDRCFYSIRRIVTGKVYMVDICDHPLDVWVFRVLCALFLLGGGMSGALIYLRYHNSNTKHSNSKRLDKEKWVKLTSSPSKAVPGPWQVNFKNGELLLVSTKWTLAARVARVKGKVKVTGAQLRWHVEADPSAPNSLIE